MRKKRRAQRVKSAAVAVATICVWAVAGFLIAKSLDHPGEQHVSGGAYMAEIAQHAPEQPVEERLPADEPELYDVPLEEELQLHIIATCEAYHVDPAIVLAMIRRESNYRANAIGDGGDSLGMCQVQPRWHYDRMERLNCPDLLDPYQNVTVAVDYLAECIDRYDGDVAKALTSYNRGHYAGEITEYALDVLDMAEALRH